MLSDSSTGKRWFESIVQLVILYSIVAYYVEAEMLEEGSVAALAVFFQWNERIVGAFFTLEYLFRWKHSKNPRRYPFTLLAIIDMLAVLPFFVAITVNMRSLRLVRTFRILFVLRLFKLYRYNIALQNVMHGFRKVKDELAVVGFVVVIMVMFSAVAMHEFEHEVQPDKFAHLSDAVWWSFVTLTTVGYGDLYPMTAGGRVIAVITMTVGIGIFGTFISLIGSSFLSTMRDQQESRQQPMRQPHFSTTSYPAEHQSWDDTVRANVDPTAETVRADSDPAAETVRANADPAAETVSAGGVGSGAGGRASRPSPLMEPAFQPVAATAGAPGRRASSLRSDRPSR